MKKHTLILWFSAVTVLLTLRSCAGDQRESAGDEKSITVSIEPLRFFAEQIAGDKWHVETLLDKGADPENFDPSIAMMRRLADSEIYFTAGHIPFEKALVSRIDTTRTKVTDTSEGITLISDTHSHDGHSHSAADPHTWSSVANARIIAANMARALAASDPDNKEFYATRLKRLNLRLDSIDTTIDSLLAPRRGEVFLMWHPSLSYFARDYGLQQVAFSAENKELSATALRRKLDSARASQAMVFLSQPEMDSSHASEIAVQAGVSTAEINPMTYDWPDEMLRIARAISGTESK